MTDERVREIALIALAGTHQHTMLGKVEQAILTAWREGMQEAAGIADNSTMGTYAAAAIRERI